VQQRMSALHPKATMKAYIRKRLCPLFPRKRTCALQSEMSAKGHKRTSERLRAFREQRGHTWQDHPDFGELAGLCIHFD
jgi:hypothetical protein